MRLLHGIEIYLPPILMGMGESQLPFHPKSHYPIPFAIIPSQSQIPSQIPFKSSDRRRTIIPPFEPALRDESNGGIPILPQPLDVEIFDEMSNGAVSKVIMPI